MKKEGYKGSWGFPVFEQLVKNAREQAATISDLKLQLMEAGGDSDSESDDDGYD